MSGVYWRYAVVSDRYVRRDHGAAPTGHVYTAPDTFPGGSLGAEDDRPGLGDLASARPLALGFSAFWTVQKRVQE